MSTQSSTRAVQNLRGGSNPHCTSLIADVLPEAKTPCSDVCSQTGVSTRNVHKASTKSEESLKHKSSSTKLIKHWFALRTTYGREKKAYDFIIEHNGTAFYPTITTEKIVHGKKEFRETSRIPNMFFAYGTEEDIKSFVYDNYNLPFLRFYYKHTHKGAKIEKTPLIVPDSQIRTLMKICTASNSDVLITTEEIRKFMSGEMVKVIDGNFKGVEGIVARYQGQQRVGIVIGGLLTAITAYIPSAFLERL